MTIEQPLFIGDCVCLGPIDHEKDPEIESKWTQDPAYLRMLSLEPARPRAAAQLKKAYEAVEKEMDEGRRLFYFTIRNKEDDRLMGFVKIRWVEWSNGSAHMDIGIGSPDDRCKGYGTEALQLALRYAFGELNLNRLSVEIPEYNEPALRLFKKMGFVQEVCQRQAAYRDGRRWDVYYLGLLREDWEGRQA
jgi:RimJ/RimL family protein N-acetyltransferase